MLPGKSIKLTLRSLNSSKLLLKSQLLAQKRIVRCFCKLIPTLLYQCCKSNGNQILTLIWLLELLLQGFLKLKWLLNNYKLAQFFVLQTTWFNNKTKSTQRAKKHQIWCRCRDSKLIFLIFKRSMQFNSTSSTLA